MLDPLTRPIIIPLLAGLLCGLLPRRWERRRGWLAIAACTITLLVVWPLLFVGVQEVVLGDSLSFRLDELSRFVLLAVAVFASLIAVFSLDYAQRIAAHRSYFACLLFSLAFANGVLLTNDLLFFVICWGLLAVTLYLMIGLAGPDASAAAQKTFMIVGGSDALLILGATLVWLENGTSRMDAGPLPLDSTANDIAFVCFVVAAFAKAAAVPLHSWLPDCAEKADAPVTAYLPAALDKLLGIYLLVRVATDLFVMTAGTNLLFLILGAVTIASAALLALVQRDLKRLLAYCAVGQVGYILLGIGTATALGLAAALFHMMNHAIYKSCLFLGAGVVETKTGTVDLDHLGGLATRLPYTFAAFLAASLAVSGIPPLNGFASKWMVYQAVIESGQSAGGLLWTVWLAAAMMGSALTLALFVKVLHGVFLCKPSPQVRFRDVHNAAWPAVVPMALLAGLCVVFGIFADAIPLKWLILPAVRQPVELPGMWWLGRAAGLLSLAFLAGWMVYIVAMRQGQLRKVTTYIGGERLDETRIPGVPMGADRHVEVTGTDFYRTVERLPLVKQLYHVFRIKVFDLYELTSAFANSLTTLLRAAHSGVLSSYLAWFVLGLIGILFVMMEGID